MYLGQLVEVSESNEIYKNPLHPYTKGLLGSIPIANPKLARMKEKSGMEGDIPSPIDRLQAAVSIPDALMRRTSVLNRCRSLKMRETGI